MTPHNTRKTQKTLSAALSAPAAAGRLLKCACVACSLIGAAVQANGQDAYWQQRVSLFDRLAVTPGDIVFLGNSITDGGEFAEIFEMDNCLNRGIRSDVINGVRKRLHQVVSGHPKKIFLLIGINDVSHGHSAQKIAANYEQLVKEIREASPETQLYVQSVMPINNDFKRYKNLIGRENVIPELNALLEGIARDNGAIYIDLWPSLTGADGKKMDRNFTNDGLHLTGPGYQAWAEAIRPYVKSAESDLPIAQPDSTDEDGSRPAEETLLPLKNKIE